VRILFVTETIPFPLDTGGRIKTHQTLRLLARRHEVHLHAFIRTPREREHLAALEGVCASVVLHLVERSVAGEVSDLLSSAVRRQPFSIRRHWRSRVAGAIAEDAARVAPDLVYCDHLSTLQYGLPLRLPVFHDAHNVEFALVKRFAEAHRVSARGWLATVEWRALRAYERRVYPACGAISAVSEIDAAALRALAGPAPAIHVIPIAFDASAFAPRTDIHPGAAVLFVGGLHWPPNEAGVAFFAREVWPRVRTHRPDATCVVVGRATASQRAALQREGLSIVGYAESVEPHFAAARVFVVPLLAGGGMRVKILEAFARGVPVVSTRVGAEGIDGVDGEHFLLADGPDDLARATLDLLGDDGLARRLVNAGRRLLDDRYSLEAITGGLESALSSVLAKSPRTSAL
jgi:polysaccharide biosynthesis protein PslH